MSNNIQHQQWKIQFRRKFNYISALFKAQNSILLMLGKKKQIEIFMQ